MTLCLVLDKSVGMWTCYKCVRSENLQPYLITDKTTGIITLHGCHHIAAP